ncbi:glutamine synthetase/guanido kinase [Hypoxylon trugodes]|uniref:glutamine synthetase/guanido kinase n=1 Tax=Hypoxylon trugodes TaxID=326681 RepID=UPI00218F0671|nr:glutamine synthetase/guanido kinase [Hypoxylon trugodes]KAI1394318.1 glutamine synthetase/guanido kinase [Hypoxylon trugodes]
MASAYEDFKLLTAAIDNTPLIDNHAHPLLKADSVNKHPLLSIATEANGDALETSKNSLSHIRTVKHLAEVLGCEQTWDAVETGVERKRLESRDGWIKRCFDGIETILIDDGLDIPGQAETCSWHSQFTKSECKRIVRLETVASDIIARHFVPASGPAHITEKDSRQFLDLFSAEIVKAISDPEVVGFKSIICYRRGLDIPPIEDLDAPGVTLTLKEIANAGLKTEERVGSSLRRRLENSDLNCLIVHVAAQYVNDAPGPKKPIQFHTGLGDNDMTLTKSSPSHLQTFIRGYPNVPIVLLHAGYPWTRETAYLAAMYPNVYADIGEVFPCISRQGQEGVVKEMLEVCPWSKILCSTDGHGFPEMFLTATTQIRSVLKTVLGELIQVQQLDEKQAVRLAQDILFFNSKKLYNLETKSMPPSITQLPLLPKTTWSNQTIIQKLQSLNAKYLRVYWHDYTSSSKCRLIPIKQVYRTLSSGKPVTLNITQCVFGLLQTDAMIPQVNASGMYVVQTDWSTLKPGPADGHVSCFGYFTQQDGSEVPTCPRSLLRRIINNAAAQGLTFLFGFEIEFVVMERNPDRNSPDKFQTLRTDGHSWSMSRILADWGREGSFSTAVDEILDALEEADIAVDQFHPENAPGQFELVLGALPPLEACDSVLHARQILESVSARHGFRVTLHPKPFATACGSASHTHLSISSPGGDKPELYESFYAGILTHLRAILAFTYSNPTSYERMLDSFWAGGRWITWGTQNKEAPLRKVEGSHWEIKTVDGLANPYFAVAAFIVAGVDGINKKISLTWGDCLGDPARFSAQERKELGIEVMFPADLREALGALKEDEVLGELLHRDVVQRYVDVKEAELKMLEPMTSEDRRRWVMERY